MSSDLIASILSSLKESGVIPDVIPESLNFAPSEFFTVAYPSKTLTEVGSKFTKDETQQEPELYLIDNDEGEAAAEETYTLVMTDPDAPSRADPKYGQWRHWVVSLGLAQVQGMRRDAWNGAVDPWFEGPEWRKRRSTKDASLTDPVLRSLASSWQWASSLWYVNSPHAWILRYSHTDLTQSSSCSRTPHPITPSQLKPSSTMASSPLAETGML